MMKKLILLFGIIFSGFVFGQSNVQPEEIQNKDTSSVHPEFQGGLEGFRNAFTKTFNSDKLKGKGIYKTLITFIVDEKGSVSDIKAKGTNITLNEAAVKAVKKIKGKWNPGILKGKAVKSTFSFPVTMKLD